MIAHSFPAKYDYYPWMGFRPSQLLKRSVRWWHWLTAVFRRFDMVYVDREIFDSPSGEMEERFRAACGRLVLDVDDAVFLRYPEKFAHLFRTADLVVCGNTAIQQHVSALNSSTVHVPTSVDLDEYRIRTWDRPSTALPTVGWIGTAGNLQYLSVAAEALRMVAQEIGFQLRLVVPDTGALNQMDLSGVQISQVCWSAATEQTELRQFDVGLMPLFPGQEWDRFKCGAKLIQYLAVGVPGIASPIGVNAEILERDGGGIAAVTTAEWADALRRLLTNAELRKDMGLRGRRTVEERYSIQANYPILRDALLNLAPRS